MENIIGMDMDDVICNTSSAIEKFAREKCDFSIDWDKVTKYDLEEVPDVIPPHIADVIVTALFNTDIIDISTPNISVKTSIDKLYANGFKVVIITSRPLSLTRSTDQWLRNHCIKYEGIYSSPGLQKFEVIQRLGVKAFIDDREDVIDSIHCNCGDLEHGLYIFDKPWNRQYNNKNVTRVNSVIEAVNSIINGGGYNG